MANATNAASKTGPIDFSHLDAYTAGDVQLTNEVLSLFKVQGIVLLQRLEGLPDARTWRETAHALKGAARGIGAWRVAELAQDVEALALASSDKRDGGLRPLAAAFAEAAMAIDARR